MARLIRIFITLACAGALCAALVGCAAPPQSSSAAQADSVAQNRQYMSALSQMSTDLAERLNSFDDAVSRNDTVGMRTQADDAFQVIEKMKSQDAPEDLTELKDGYMQACDGLKSALESYIALYEDVTSDPSFDYSTYEARVRSIQEEYDKAAALLEDTDQKATELQK